MENPLWKIGVCAAVAIIVITGAMTWVERSFFDGAVLAGKVSIDSRMNIPEGIAAFLGIMIGASWMQILENGGKNGKR